MRKLLLLLLLAGCTGSLRDSSGPPYEPEETLSLFEIEEGFSIEVFGAEPLITDPVAMEVDEDGRVYVVEMPGYPLDVGGSGRVKLLEDTDGDGYPDRSTVFADNLILPNGIIRWKRGILVTDAPDVLYLEDTDGDGKADRRETMLTGFALSNPQHKVNNPRYGLDNWIHLANEGTVWTDRFEQFKDQGSDVRYADRESPRLSRNADGRAVRFRPDAYELEMRSGESQFGHTFDAWGHHFGVSNAHRQFHEVIGARYLRRNPDLLISDATHSTPEDGNPGNVYPITLAPEHQLLTDRGVFTSASGIVYYLGGLFPAEYENTTFVTESVHNLVHSDKVSDDGATFVARRMHEGHEFLASKDAWFRPVNLYVGPDGALYVIDYYRQIVEHPEWMDDAAAKSGDLYRGSDKGRIYRIVPSGTPVPDWTNALTLSSARVEELVELLGHRNYWWRITAQRLLVDRKDTTSIPLLRQLATGSQMPMGRLHALWTLEGMQALDTSLVALALRDREAGIRENAIRLAEPSLNTAPTLIADLISMENDPDAKVRFQLLCTLGNVESEEAGQVRQRLLFRDIEDDWIQVAALTAGNVDAASLLDEAITRLSSRETEGHSNYFERLGALIGTRRAPGAVHSVIDRWTRTQALESAWWRAAVFEGLAAGIRRKEASRALSETERWTLLHSVLAEPSPAVRRAYLDLLSVTGMPAEHKPVIEDASRMVSDLNTDPELRADAIRMLSLTDPDQQEDLFKAVIVPGETAAVQQAAIRALGNVKGTNIGSFLLDHWKELTPELRDEAVGAMMKDTARVRMLLDAVEAGTVQPSTLGWQRRVVLMRDFEGPLRDRARVLLREDAGIREAVLRDYRPVLDQEGEVASGVQVYQNVCSTCHQVNEKGGTAFGPDLATVRHWSAEALLAKILNPSRSISDGYELWMARLKDGETVSGVIASETPTTITLRNQGGVERTIARSDIAELEASGVTAMPTGLESQISHEDMANLIAFIRFNHGDEL